jgi:hypothetical protein
MRSICFKDGDILIKDKRLQMVDDLDQKKQKTAGILSVVKGELFYNAGLGLDYTQVLDVNQKNIEDDIKRMAVMEALRYDENVDKVIGVAFKEDPQNSQKQLIDVLLQYKDEAAPTEIGGVNVG